MYTCPILSYGMEVSLGYLTVSQSESTLYNCLNVKELLARSRREVWVFVYELSGSGFVSTSSHLNFRFRTCFEQGVSWYSGNYRVWIHSKTPTWHDKNIQLKNFVEFMQNQHLFDSLIANISRAVGQSPINHIHSVLPLSFL